MSVKHFPVTETWLRRMKTKGCSCRCELCDKPLEVDQEVTSQWGSKDGKRKTKHYHRACREAQYL